MAGGPFIYTQTYSNGFVVEFFVPKHLSYLGAIYSRLKVELESENSDLANIEGFSIYEVSGAFKGKRQNKIYSEDTLVIRVFFDKATLSGGIEIGLDPNTVALEALKAKVGDLLNQVAEACNNDEEQIWAVLQSDVHVYKLVGKKVRSTKRK